MTVADLLNVTDGGQQIRITAATSLKDLYVGQAWNAPYGDCEVVAIYSEGCKIVVGVI